MPNPARIYADFQRTDDEDRLVLDSRGTADDLAEHEIELVDGMSLTFYTDDLDDAGARDDLVVDGTVSFDREHQRWVASIDWAEMRHESELCEREPRQD